MFINMLKVYEIMGLGFLESNAAQIRPELGEQPFLPFMEVLTIVCPWSLFIDLKKYILMLVVAVMQVEN